MGRGVKPIWPIPGFWKLLFPQTMPKLILCQSDETGDDDDPDDNDDDGDDEDDDDEDDDDDD